MIFNKKATSVVEAMVVLLIIVSWVVWMYQVFWNSKKLSDSTANKIQAISMAREWIEAMKNIRDTNWLLFSSDTTNCWNVDNYNSHCVWDNGTSYDIKKNSYKIFQKADNRWYLSKKNTSETSFSKSAYRDEMKVWLDSNWFFTQTWIVSEISPIFTREIQISYLKDNNSVWNSNDPKMKVKSIVQWVDSSSTQVHKVEFTSILTNYKK